mgnify:FL=1
MPKSNTDFWEKKFSANVERDQRVKSELAALGWKVITVWECELKDLEILKLKLISRINDEELMMVAEKKQEYNKQ